MVIDTGEKRRQQRSALDELFIGARRYRTSRSFRELMTFVTRFRFYSPYNAMLLHIQRPGAQFVAPASRWMELYNHRVLPDARPLVILQPMGPVMFVFDVVDTEPMPNAPPLPAEVVDPFSAIGPHQAGVMDRTRENAIRDGVRTAFSDDGSQSAGRIRTVDQGPAVERIFGKGSRRRTASHPVRYDVAINKNLAEAARYATMLHELAHLYCGHLGTPSEEWWPDRRNLGHQLEELEAECAAYLVCTRAGIDPASSRYLSSFLPVEDVELPPISLETILRAAGLLEFMGGRRLPRRKSPTRKAAKE